MPSPAETSAAARLTWSAALDWLKTCQLVPIENFASLPCPTLAYGRPAFAFFACAALRKPGEPTRCGPPTRTLAITALGAWLLTYNWAIDGQQATNADLSAQVILLDPPRESIEAADQRLAALRLIMDEATNDFFDGQPARHGADLLAAFQGSAPPALMPFYRDRAPDFFDWLEGEPAATSGGGS